MRARERVDYIFPMILLLTILMSTTIHAAQFGCEIDLTIAHLSATAAPPITQNELLLGLPLGQSHRPEWADGGGWSFETNLGTTWWSDTNELKGWFALSEIMNDEWQAADLIRRISRESEYCPPGLNPDFCTHLRVRFLDDSARHNPGAFKGGGGILVTRDSSEAAKRRNENLGGLNLQIPWSLDPATGEFVGINPDPAQLILLMMARENLLRHLRFIDHAGNVRSGAELDLMSRMAVAMRPSLINMVPLFLLRPIEKARGIMGNPRAPTGGLFQLIERHFLLAGTGETYRFSVMSSVSKPVESSLRVDFSNVKFLKDQVAVPYPANLKFEREFSALRFRFEEAASTLASANGLPPRVTLEPVRSWREFTGIGVVKVEVEGLSPLDTLLLFYKVADSL